MLYSSLVSNRTALLQIIEKLIDSENESMPIKPPAVRIYCKRCKWQQDVIPLSDVVPSEYGREICPRCSSKLHRKELNEFIAKVSSLLKKLT